MSTVKRSVFSKIKDWNTTRKNNKIQKKELIKHNKELIETLHNLLFDDSSYDLDLEQKLKDSCFNSNEFTESEKRTLKRILPKVKIIFRDNNKKLMEFRSSLNSNDIDIFNERIVQLINSSKIIYLRDKKLDLTQEHLNYRRFISKKLKLKYNLFIENEYHNMMNSKKASVEQSPIMAKPSRKSRKTKSNKK